MPYTERLGGWRCKGRSANPNFLKPTVRKLLIFDVGSRCFGVLQTLPKHCVQPNQRTAGRLVLSLGCAHVHRYVAFILESRGVRYDWNNYGGTRSQWAVRSNQLSSEN